MRLQKATLSRLRLQKHLEIAVVTVWPLPHSHWYCSRNCDKTKINHFRSISPTYKLPNPQEYIELSLANVPPRSKITIEANVSLLQRVFEGPEHPFHLCRGSYYQAGFGVPWFTKSIILGPFPPRTSSQTIRST